MSVRLKSLGRMIIETNEDKVREKKAIQKFVDRFSGSFKKLSPSDIDYRVFDKDNNLIAYAEVKPIYKPLSQSYPLPIEARKVVKVCDKILNPVIIWACDDGIIYARPSEIEGQAVCENNEMIIYYNKQSGTKYIRGY